MMRVARPADELAVVRDEDQRAREFLEPDLQRFDGLHVHVVGRLVQQQHVGPAQHQLAVDHPALLAAGKHLTDFLVSSPENSSRPSVARTIWSSSALPVYWDIQVNRSHSRHELGLRVLRHVARFGVLDPHDAPGRGRQLAGETAHQRGLADAVRADDGDALARLDVKAHVVEHFARAAPG